jgi:CRP/FNR family transcriptional regulator
MKQISSAFVAEPPLLEELVRRSTPIALGENRVLFREGDAPSGVYIVKKGRATLTSGSNGSTVLMIEAGAGSLLGVPAVIGTKAYSLTAVAEEDAELSMVSCEDFVDLMQSEPQLAFQVLKVLAEEVRFAREALVHH